MNMKNPYVMAITSFMITWQATGFALDYRAVLSSILTGVLGYSAPKKK